MCIRDRYQRRVHGYGGRKGLVVGFAKAENSAAGLSVVAKGVEQTLSRNAYSHLAVAREAEDLFAFESCDWAWDCLQKRQCVPFPVACKRPPTIDVAGRGKGESDLGAKCKEADGLVRQLKTNGCGQLRLRAPYLARERGVGGRPYGDLGRGRIEAGCCRLSHFYYSCIVPINLKFKPHSCTPVSYTHLTLPTICSV
eukprot:TRINITY_DN15709_c0_g1_i1.p1 TRINITY_DN15709_c0_g1~~TRINITY_DN15709_c0_g1_i1.p1  ORF type:complete len:197 (+),score=1.43 TRINITY_DN15709_c0_g1_i1:73-663(+)